MTKEERAIEFETKRKALIARLNREVRAIEKEMEQLANEYQYTIWYTTHSEVTQVPESECSKAWNYLEETWKIFIPENVNKDEMRNNNFERAHLTLASKNDDKRGFWFHSSLC